jgi:hypothetical protein
MPGANIVAACLAKRVGQPSPMVLAGYTKSGHQKPALNPSLLAIVDPPDSASQYRVACPLGKKPYMIAVQSDDSGSDLCAVCIISGRTIQNIGAVYSCLSEMMERYVMVMNDDDGSDSDRLISDNSTQLSKDVHSLVVKYNDPNAQTVNKLKGQMKDIQASLSSAIAVLMLRGDKLNDLLDNAEQMAEKASEVETLARNVYMMMLWRYWKWILMIVCGLAIFIGIIVAIACGGGSC